VAVTTFGTLGALADVRGAEVAMRVVDDAHYVKNQAKKNPPAAVSPEAPSGLLLYEALRTAIEGAGSW